MEYKCKYCGKIFDNKRSKGQHESYCILNPNRKRKCAWNKGKNSNTDERILKIKETRHKNFLAGKIKIKPHKWTEEERNKMSLIRKKWLNENPDKHPWKNRKCNYSKPCEYLKEILKLNNISFVEEYNPKINGHYFSLDIAFPDIKFAIEVNGNQHYKKDGNLNEYYQNRHNLLKENGWKIMELHYTKCYDFNISILNKINDLNDFLDKDYVNKYFSRKDEKKNQIIYEKELKNKKKKEEFSNRKKILLDLLNNSNINFNKQGWVNKAFKYFNDKEIWFKSNLKREIFKYIPEYGNKFFWRKYK